jgi:hypothetical protein
VRTEKEKKMQPSDRTNAARATATVRDERTGLPVHDYGTREPTLGELFSDLAGDLSTLVRQEIALARAETMETARAAARNSAMMGVGGALAYAGLIVLLIAIAYLLGEVMPLWLATLIVGVIAAAIGGALIMAGKNRMANLSVMPERTVESIKEDAQWAKEQVQ